MTHAEVRIIVELFHTGKQKYAKDGHLTNDSYRIAVEKAERKLKECLKKAVND